MADMAAIDSSFLLTHKEITKDDNIPIPKLIEVENVGRTLLKVVFQRLSSVEHYLLEWSPDGRMWDEDSSVICHSKPRNDERHVIHFLEGLSPGTEYSVRVTALKFPGGNVEEKPDVSSRSSVVCARTSDIEWELAIPILPPHLGSDEKDKRLITSSELSVMWEPVPHAYKYQIEVQYPGTLGTLWRSSWQVLEKQVRRPSIVVRKLEAGTSYRIRVSPVRGDGLVGAVGPDSEDFVTLTHEEHKYILQQEICKMMRADNCIAKLRMQLRMLQTREMLERGSARMATTRAIDLERKLAAAYPEIEKMREEMTILKHSIDVACGMIEDETGNGFLIACQKKCVGLVHRMMEKGTRNWNFGLFGACFGGHLDLVNLMIEKGANDWNNGLFSACEGGHLDLVNLMIAKGANNLYYGLEGACRGGHRDIINWMIDYAGRQKGGNNWNSGLYGACCGGHGEIVGMMIERGANDWNRGLYGACSGGHFDIVMLMIERGANNWNDGLEGACCGGHGEIVGMMIGRGANNWNRGLRGARSEGHHDIVKLMIEKGARD